MQRVERLLHDDDRPVDVDGTHAYQLPHSRAAYGWLLPAIGFTERQDFGDWSGWSSDKGPAEYPYSPGYYALFFSDPNGIKLEYAYVP